MSPESRGALVIAVLIFLYLWGASALAYLLTGVPG